jgi:CheY-like chemotaxis protein
MRAPWPPDAAPPAGATRPSSALILDDEADRRIAMRRALRDHGVRSDTAATLEDAIRLLACRPYDLVVCDLILCDPPEASNPALRGYLAVCFALARPRPGIVVQASSMRRWAHPGAVLTNFEVVEVANVVYGSTGIPRSQSGDGGCPWDALRRAAGAAGGDGRRRAAADLAGLPIVREMAGSLRLQPRLEALEDAAEGGGGWDAAIAGLRYALFPGAGDVW